MTRRLRSALLLCCVALLAVSCAAPSSAPAGGAPGSGAASSNPSSQAPKTLRWAVDASGEPNTGMVLFGRGAAVGAESALMFHAGLTVWDENSNVVPRLAERLPTVENGDWKVAPDGSMEVTWHLRPD